VVPHPPAATLDFPLSNDPQTYRQYNAHDFAVQVDQDMLDSRAGSTTGTGDTAAAAADKIAAADVAKAVDLEEGRAGRLNGFASLAWCFGSVVSRAWDTRSPATIAVTGGVDPVGYPDIDTLISNLNNL
jgi:hypothetical protein